MFLVPGITLGPFSISLTGLEANRVVFSIGLVIASGVLVLLLSQFILRISRAAGVRASTQRTIRDTITILWLLLLAFGLLSIWNLTSEFGFLTLSGIVGLAVSLALQTTLTNMISGIFLLRDQLVRIGDEITYSGSTHGRIIRVTLRNTWVLTDKGDVAVIGNSNLAAGPLVNHSAGKIFALTYGGGMAPVGTAPAAPTPATVPAGPVASAAPAQK